jgi:primary-amine oxidase
MAQVVTDPATGRGREVPLHPLDPLSAAELEAIVAGVRRARSLDERHLLASVRLLEPPKAEVLAFREGDALDRAARVEVWDRRARTLAEAVVTTAGELRSWRELGDARPGVMFCEAGDAIEAVKADVRVREGLARRGITDVEHLHVEIWPFGGLVPDHLADGRRLGWTPLWARDGAGDNAYAHPIRGLYAVVDLDASAVLEVEDHGVAPVPQEPGPFRVEALPAPRADLRDLQVVQSEGPSFVVDGWQIRWQKWSFRVGFCPREGLVVHDVRYDDGGEERRIAHRMSIAELVIPYGDPSPSGYRKNAFDTGEVGMGLLTNSLELGCDCLGEIRYLDVSVADADGGVRTIRNGICLHEEDDGILWKHTDPDGHVEVRRSRRFVVSSIVTVDNYEYGYFWYFRQDGAIEFEAKLTGIVLTFAAEPGQERPLHATEIAPGLVAPYHQHVLCARLDLDVDGETNSVLEVDGIAPPTGPDNPYGGAYVAQETPLRSESEAQRLVDPLRSRYWKIVNPRRRHRLGGPVGYKLVPGLTTYPLADPASSIGRRAAFMYRHLWVTPYAEDERYPAGEHPFQHPGGAGLPAFTAADRPLVDTDVVLWYVFGSNHVPRPEDWPVMPVERVGFELKPFAFFERSPALDVPAPRHACH